MGLTNKEYLKRVRTFKDSCEKYLDTNQITQWKKNDNMYRMIHENKAIETDARYKHRSKLYIPKARNAMIRKLAAYVATYFSNPDVVNLQPRLKGNAEMEQAAKLLFSAVNYRLKYSYKFFLNAVFAWFDMMKYGRGIVTMGWDYIEDTKKVKEPKLDDMGTPTGEDVTLEEVIVLKDEPNMRHVPLTHLFVAPNANPIDPINTSPILIEKMPVFVYDAKQRIESGEWKKPEDYEKDFDFSPYGWSPTEFDEEIYPEETIDFDKNPEWQQIEVWRCFVNLDGKDMFFLSLTDQHMLTDPEDAEEKFPCRGRPYVMGGIIPDPQTVYWPSFLETVDGLQRELNAIRNQRRDNVTLALNKKILVRSNCGIDLGSLLYSRPGAPIVGNDIGEMAVRELVYTDVTSSSYKEQQMNEQAFEETTGITPYNMGAQRPGMNQTATGTSVLTESANTGIVMDMSFINETFMIPVLEMATQFVQAYENEATLRHVADQEGIDFDTIWTRDAIEAKYDVEVQAGVGSTNREMKFRNLGMLIDRAMALNTQYGAPVMNIIEMVKDALPLSGHMNPDKYINQQVIDAIMAKFGQVTQTSLQNPALMPPNLMNPANSGGAGIPSVMPAQGGPGGSGQESGQGFGGDSQIYRSGSR